MRTRLLAVPLSAFVALAIPCTALAGKYRPQGRPVPYEGFFATFPSGMRLVVYEMPAVDRFAVTVSYGSGSAEDPEGKEGLAHVAEHLAYRAASPAGAPIWDRLLAEGFKFNAFTDFDRTDFYVVGKPAGLRTALLLEAARMRDSLRGVTGDDLAVERDVVVSEYRERFETDPQGAELRWVLEEAFPGHAYGRSPAGTPASLRAIALEDVRAWTKERYLPQNAVMVVIAPRKARETVSLVAEVFGELAVPPGSAKQAPMARPIPGMPPPPEPEIAPAARPGPVRQPVLWVAWPVPGDRSKRDPQAHAAVAALQAAFSRKLPQVFGSSAGEIVQGWDAGFVSWAGAGLIYLRAELAKQGDAGKVADLIKSAAFELRGADLAGAWRSLSAANRLSLTATVRDQLLMQGYLDLESIDGSSVARFLRATGQADYLAGWQKLVAVQLRFDMSNYASEFLRRDRAAVVVVVPDKNTLARAIVPVVARGERLDEQGQAVIAGGADAAAAAGVPGLARAERRVLSNGLTVAVLQRGALPIAEVQLLMRSRPTGSEEIPAGLPELALGSNFARFSERDLWLVAGMGATAAGKEEVLRVSRGSSANLDVLLQSAAEWARDQEARYFDKAKEGTIRYLARTENDPIHQARRVFREALFPGHPYGALASASRLKKVSARDADRWLSAEIRPERATLIVVSDQAPTPELWSAIEGHFGGWRRGDVDRVAAAAPPAPAARRIILVDRPGASQALLAMGVRAPPRRARDEAALGAVRWLVQDRLNQRIRVEEGVSYGVQVQLLDHEQGAALFVAATVDRDAAASSLATILAAPGALAEKPLPVDQVTRARWQVARAFAYGFDTVGDVAGALADLVRDELPADHYEKQPASIAALDPARIQAAAARLGVGKEAGVILGDAAVLRPQLEKAGFTVEAAAAP